MEDEAIVELYLARDESAISHTSEKYGSKLRSLAKRITEDDFMADECENDTYMKAWNSIPPHEPRTYLFAFLARITRHLALNLCEKNRTQKRSGTFVDLGEEIESVIAAPDNTESVVDDMVLRESLNRFLAELDEEKRNIFLRRYWFFDDIETLSDRFGYSRSKIKSLLMRLRGKLREHLEKDGIGV
ncbi:MAG: sigma-70 family RNA polymerase sigma factor [Ruminiclostridium sp.]|nr:sigma-70 family RNA polymerase sigma factor [Ruminiclostridium sp.]